MTPRRVRPNQVFQIFATILRLEYSEISLRVSIIKENQEYTETVMKFDQPGSRIMQMLVCIYWEIITFRQHEVSGFVFVFFKKDNFAST